MNPTLTIPKTTDPAHDNAEICKAVQRLEAEIRAKVASEREERERLEEMARRCK
jgi:uncharacterized protein (DUF849 family)